MNGQRLARLRPAKMLAVLLFVIPALLLGACGEDGAEVTLPEGELPEVTATLPEVEVPDVEVPEGELPEVAPEPEPEAEDDGSSAPLWVVVILAIIIIGFISYFGARSGSKKQSQSAPAQAPAPPPPAAPAGWKEDARTAYAEARWLYDEMDVELATWRGDTLYEAQASTSTAAINTTHQSTWNQLPARMSAARDALYRVESTSGDPHVAQLATAVIDNLNSTRSAVDSVADARRNRRAAEDAGTDAGAIDSNRQAESRAADELAADRRRLGDAISNLSSAL